MRLDPRIGQLSSGKFYCFPEGNGKPEFIGTLEEVEVSLGLRPPPMPAAAVSAPQPLSSWTVMLTFQYPAWDEVAGICYPGIAAKGKADAIAQARRRARDDGHTVGGRGRYWFSATADEA